MKRLGLATIVVVAGMSLAGCGVGEFGGVYNLPGQGYLSVKAGNKLKIKLSATNTVTASFYGTEDVA